MDDSVRRELYRPARLTIDDVAFLVIEPPDDGASLASKGGPIRIDAGQGRPQQSSSSLPDLPPEMPITWMYLGQLNAFLLFSAGHASLSRTGPGDEMIVSDPDILTPGRAPPEWSIRVCPSR